MYETFLKWDVYSIRIYYFSVWRSNQERQTKASKIKQKEQQTQYLIEALDAFPLPDIIKQEFYRLFSEYYIVHEFNRERINRYICKSGDSTKNPSLCE